MSVERQKSILSMLLIVLIGLILFASGVSRVAEPELQVQAETQTAQINTCEEP